MTPEDTQSIRSAVQRKLHAMPPAARWAFERANRVAKVAEPDKPEETDTEGQLEKPFTRQKRPGPRLQFRLRKATDDEKQAHLNRESTQRAAVVVNHNAADKLAAAIERQRNIGKRKLGGTECRTSFDRTSDRLADALKRQENKRTDSITVSECVATKSRDLERISTFCCWLHARKSCHTTQSISRAGIFRYPRRLKVLNIFWHNYISDSWHSHKKCRPPSLLFSRVGLPVHRHILEGLLLIHSVLLTFSRFLDR
jgi:hypothetical protein